MSDLEERVAALEQAVAEVINVLADPEPETVAEAMERIYQRKRAHERERT